MRTLKKEILDRLISQLPPYIVTDRLDISEWTAVPGRHVEPGVFEKHPEDTKTVGLGYQWKTSYDETVWFSASLKVPESFSDKKCYLKLIFGGEAIVRINGEIAGGISANPGSWLDRDLIFLPDPLPKQLDIEVEATVNSGEFLDTVLAGGKYMTYTISETALIAVDPVTESYVNDVTIVSDAISRITDDVVKEKVYRALDDSLHAIDYDFDAETLRKSVPGAAGILWDALDRIHYTPQGKVLMTGHSHLDVAVVWTVKETFRKCARTFSNTVELLNRYPDATFALSQAKLYDMVKTVYPELMPKIKALVKNGQWEIVGNSWVETDTNIVSGESLVRQLLYGEAFFRKEFGVTSDVYWLPDCFGFSSALPQIIKKSGMKYFITAKLKYNDTNHFPHTLFRWRGTDGSEVLGYLTRGNYGGGYNTSDVCVPWDQNENGAETDTVLGMFGYADGGGGPGMSMVEKGRRLSKIPGLPRNRMGHVREFFDAVEPHRAALPIWNGELYFEHHRGTYTSQALIKKNNRKGEYLLAETEMVECAFHLLRGEKAEPNSELTDNWKHLLVYQFHDILPGTSISEVYAATKSDYEKLLASGRRLLGNALLGIESMLPPGTVIWNPSSDSFSGYVKDSEGNGFVVTDVPALGYRVLQKTDSASPVYCENGHLENRYLAAEIDENGRLTSLIFKETGRQVLSAPGNIIKVYSDKPALESAWNMEADYVKHSWDPETVSVTCGIDGACGVVTVEKHFNRSSLVQRILLEPEGRRLNFETVMDWHETEKTVRVDFLVDVLSEFATFDIAHGAIRRPTHRNTSWDAARFEVSAHKWADISEGDFGVALMNDCKYGYSALGNVLSLTLLRSPNYPDPHADQGMHSFTYALYPHIGSWQDGGVSSEAFRLNMPVAVHRTDGNGLLPDSASLLDAGVGGNIKIDCFKAAEEGDGVILRLYETCQRRGTVEMRSFFPLENVTENDLMERPMTDPDTNLTFTESGFRFYLKPFEVKTFRLNFSGKGKNTSGQ